ncbi:hypothetical protein NW768_002511 [Fusarium equiseti]|uniref:Uncharacterized protein n=1 Tax=Fusarium equiseti TaxID=61235 RepID=A0ABQ8RNU2_FUSEQ|nr:hypothetical protein NW768_002511 [Fusarium equiseti]
MAALVNYGGPVNSKNSIKWTLAGAGIIICIILAIAACAGGKKKKEDDESEADEYPL